MQLSLRVLCASNAFKESLTAQQSCRSMAHGVRAAARSLAFPVEVLETPLADGGNSTQQVLVDALDGELVEVKVHDPLLNTVNSNYGIIHHSEGRKVAVIEMANASGLHLVEPSLRNPLKSSTLGTGELIMHAVKESRVDEIVLCIGGSATCDGGMGAAYALGYQFLTQEGVSFHPFGGSLTQLDQIIAPSPNPLEKVSLTIACDVVNPLLGEFGSVNVYAPQKGAKPSELPILEQGLSK